MYRKTWEVIASGQVKVDKRMDYCLVLSPLRPTTPDDYVALIKPDENIVLIGGGRLLNSFATYTNPWSLFWYLRIRRRLRRIDSGEHPLQARRADRLSELMG
jgi:dihydrofolate reductase